MNENTIVILIFSGMLVGLACLASVIADKQRERECKDSKTADATALAIGLRRLRCSDLVMVKRF